MPLPADVRTSDVTRLTTPLPIGNVDNGNYTRISEKGVITFVGEAVTWDFMRAEILSKSLFEKKGKVDLDWAEELIIFEKGGSLSNPADSVIWKQPWETRFQTGIDVEGILAICYVQETATEFDMELEYRVQNCGSPFTPGWEHVDFVLGGSANPQNVYSFGANPINQVLCLSPFVLPKIGHCDVVEFKLARVDGGSELLKLRNISLFARITGLGTEDIFGG